MSQDKKFEEELAEIAKEDSDKLITLRKAQEAIKKFRILLELCEKDPHSVNPDLAAKLPEIKKDCDKVSDHIKNY